MIGSPRASLLAALLVVSCAPAADSPSRGTGGTGGSGSGGSGVAGSGGSAAPMSAGAGGEGGATGGSSGATAGATGGSSAGSGGGGEPTAGTSGDDASTADGGADSATGGPGGPPSADPGTEGDGDVMVGPNFTDAPEMTVKPGIPTGTITNFVMKSTDSKFYPGLNGAFMRPVAVYVPKQYVAGSAVPFIICQDGSQWTARMQPMLDNLINDKKLPVMVAIMINNGGGDSKGSERGLEYDTVSGKYAEFVEAEVLPAVEMQAKVTLSKDPDARATLGGSSGGAAAFSMGWYHPELYHRIITYSGTYVNQQSPTNPMSPHGAWEYHEHFIPMSDPKPLRVWLEAGEKDNGAGSSAAGLHNWVLANQGMAKVLAAKKYHYRFEYALGAGHVDKRAVGQTLPEAMLWLWRGYPIQ